MTYTHNTQCYCTQFLIKAVFFSLSLSPSSVLLRETTDHLGIEFMGKEAFLVLHLSES